MLVDPTEISVLLFHDEKRQLKHFLSVLRICGLKNITVAGRISDAINCIVSTKLDLIIVVHIGAAAEVSRLMDELNMLEAIAAIPVVAITTDNDVKSALCILEKGIKAILVDPLSRGSVDNLLKKLFGDRDRSAAVAEKLEAARELVEKGEMEAARGIYHELLSESSSPDVYLGLARIEWESKKWLEADNLLKQALKLSKSYKDRIEIHRQLSKVFCQYGLFYERRRKVEPAMKSYRTSLSLNPFCVPAIKGLLCLLQKRGEVDEIVKILETVGAEFPPFSRSLDEIAECLDSLGQNYTNLNMPLQARKIFEEILKLKHRDIDIYLKLADFFSGMGQLSLTLKVLLSVNEKIKDVDLSTRIGDLLLDIEKRYFSGGHVNTAQEGVDLSFFQSVDSAKLIQLAQKVFQEGLLMDPDNGELQLSLARCSLRSGEHEAASSILENVKRRHEDDPDFLARIIESLMEENADGLVSTWLRECSASFPDNMQFCRLYADYYKKLGQYYDAVVSLKKALAIHPDHPELIVKLAEAYVDLKQYADAVLYYEKANKLLPNDASVQDGLRKALAAKYKG